MLRLFIVLLLVFLPCTYVIAQSGQSNVEQDSAQQLDELITTLESKTGRQELIDQLKTLRKANDHGNEPSDLVDWLKIDDQSSELSRNIASKMNKLGFSDTHLLQYMVFAFAFFILVAWLFLNKALSRFLQRRLQSVRRRFHLSMHRFSLFIKIQWAFGVVLSLLLFIYSSIQILDLTDQGTLFGLTFSTVMAQCFTIVFISLLFASLWEFSNFTIEYSMARSQYQNNSRIQTLLPVIRNVLLVVLITMSSLIILSELGVDIMPLLAGAGVLGIAVGFGAQTLVKDFLTGVTVILEDLLQIGDVITVGNRSGRVERISLRKIQLRDLEGIVHTVPFGEVSIVDNYTKEYSYYLFNVGIAYKEDTDQVIQHLQSIDEELRDTDEYSDMILEPLDILGLDEFADSAVIIKARIKTRAHDRWTVGREFKRRIKYVFDEHGIEIPFPHQTVYFGDSQLQLKGAGQKELPTNTKDDNGG